MSLATAVTLGLAIVALVAAIMAGTRNLRSEPAEDLERLHRMVDLVRAELAEADRDGRRLDTLHGELRMLVSKLPKGDARRRPRSSARRAPAQPPAAPGR